MLQLARRAKILYFRAFPLWRKGNCSISRNVFAISKIFLANIYSVRKYLQQIILSVIIYTHRIFCVTGRSEWILLNTCVYIAYSTVWCSVRSVHKYICKYYLLKYTAHARVVLNMHIFSANTHASVNANTQ